MFDYKKALLIANQLGPNEEYFQWVRKDEKDWRLGIWGHEAHIFVRVATYAYDNPIMDGFSITTKPIRDEEVFAAECERSILNVMRRIADIEAGE